MFDGHEKAGAQRRHALIAAISGLMPIGRLRRHSFYVELSTHFFVRWAVGSPLLRQSCANQARFHIDKRNYGACQTASPVLPVAGAARSISSVSRPAQLVLRAREEAVRHHKTADPHRQDLAKLESRAGLRLLRMGSDCRVFPDWGSKSHGYKPAGSVSTEPLLPTRSRRDQTSGSGPRLRSRQRPKIFRSWGHYRRKSKF